MRLELASATLVGAAPVALLVAGAPLESVAVVGLFALGAIALGLALRRRPDPRRGQAIQAALDDIDRELDEASEAWSEMVERSETAGRFREEFVASVRHELKTPLNAILGFSDVLLAEVDGPLTERQREDLEAVREAGAHLADLVDAVLREWRPSGGTPLPMTQVDVRKLLTRVASILRGQIGQRPIEIRVELPDPVRGPLADERRLRQVLINLGTNALRATERGEVVFSAVDEGDRVRIRVRDTGCGIDPDALPTLFGRFVQAGDDASREGGSGLGLAIAREAVEWHGGYLEIETRRGDGTTFSVVLPRGLA